jgi:hypothetical protein
MKLRDAFAEGITKVRLPMWAEGAYLETEGGDYGMRPWATLYDVAGQQALSTGPQKVLVVADTDDTWQPYDHEASE